MKRTAIIFPVAVAIFASSFTTAAAHAGCEWQLGDKPWSLLRRVGFMSNGGWLENTRGVAVDLEVGSPHLERAPESLHLQALYIWNGRAGSTNTYIEFGWEYLFDGAVYRRRLYYVNNYLGRDGSAHYIGPASLPIGTYRFYLVNYPSGTNANRFLMQTKRSNETVPTTHAIIDTSPDPDNGPGYNAGNAYTSVEISNQCNGGYINAYNGWRYSGTNNDWIQIGDSRYDVGWVSGSDALTHWDPVIAANKRDWYSRCVWNPPPPTVGGCDF